MRNEKKLIFTYLGIDISVGRYLHYEKWFYEWDTPTGNHRESLHIDMTFDSIGRAMYAGVGSVNDYFNGDPGKSTGT